MRLGVDLTHLTYPERSRSGHSVHSSQVDLRRKRTRAQAGPVRRGAPTVMVRNVAASHPAAGPLHSQKKTRRRYDIAVGLPGTEVRLPNLPQFAISWRWLSAVLALVLGLGLYQVWNAATFKVSAAEISGLQHLTPKEVNAVLGLAEQPVFSLDAGQLEDELLQAFPEFSAASVHIGLPSTVAITVTERVPVLAWMMGGNTTLVDQEGMGFPARGDISGLALPVVEPIWAIGTGKNADPTTANSIIALNIRGVLAVLYGEAVAQQIRVQYGGSVNPGNIEAYMSQPDIDGGLVGGASLKTDSFVTLVKGALVKVR